MPKPLKLKTHYASGVNSFLLLNNSPINNVLKNCRCLSSRI